MVEKASLRRFFSRFRLWILFGVLLGGLLALSALAAVAVFDVFHWMDVAREWALATMRRVPAWLYMAMIVTLPLVGFPVTLFYFTAIPVLGGPAGLYGIAGAWVGIGTGMSLAFWLSGGLLRPFLARWMARRGHTVPAIHPDNEWRVILAVRLSPLPFVFQNYTLGLAGCGFPRYLAISWPIQGLIALGFMLMGESFATGGMRHALLGAFILALCFLAMGWLRRRYRLNGGQPGSRGNRGGDKPSGVE